MSMRANSLGVDQAGGATATLVAAKTGYRIQVTSLLLSVGGAAVTVKSTLQDETANTVRLTLVGNATTPVVYAFGSDDSPVFETAVSEGLELITGAASAISGCLTWKYVK